MARVNGVNVDGDGDGDGDGDRDGDGDGEWLHEQGRVIRCWPPFSGDSSARVCINSLWRFGGKVLMVH